MPALRHPLNPDVSMGWIPLLRKRDFGCPAAIQLQRIPTVTNGQFAACLCRLEQDDPGYAKVLLPLADGIFQQLLAADPRHQPRGGVEPFVAGEEGFARQNVPEQPIGFVFVSGTLFRSGRQMRWRDYLS